LRDGKNCTLTEIHEFRSLAVRGVVRIQTAESSPTEYHLAQWRDPPPSRTYDANAVNPNWGRFMPPAPVLATEFELQVRKLHLTPEKYVFPSELETWCEENRNRVYIPER
jgi:hypothetical protein